MIEMGPVYPSEEIHRCFMEQAANFSGLAAVLMEKGLLTYEEWDAARIKCLAGLDQHVAMRRDEALKKYLDK